MSENGHIICMGRMELSANDKKAINMLKTKNTTISSISGFEKFLYWMKNQNKNIPFTPEKISRNIVKIQKNDQIYYLAVSTTRKEINDDSIVFTIPSLAPVKDQINLTNVGCKIFRVFVFDTDNSICSNNIRAKEINVVKIDDDDIKYTVNSYKQTWNSYQGKDALNVANLYYEEIWK